MTATRRRTNFARGCRPTRIERHAGGPKFPATYTVQYTCGHPTIYFATPRSAAGMVFGTIEVCRECAWNRNV